MAYTEITPKVCILPVFFLSILKPKYECKSQDLSSGTDNNSFYSAVTVSAVVTATCT